MIGSLGSNIIFEVSNKTVKTFDGMTWSTQADYAEINRHMLDDLKEFCGMKNESITFSITFSASMGVNPEKEYIKLLNACRNAEILPLLIGAKLYGKYRWVIMSISNKLNNFDGRGNLLSCTCDVTLGEYAKR